MTQNNKFSEERHSPLQDPVLHHLLTKTTVVPLSLRERIIRSPWPNVLPLSVSKRGSVVVPVHLPDLCTWTLTPFRAGNRPVPSSSEEVKPECQGSPVTKSRYLHFILSACGGVKWERTTRLDDGFFPRPDRNTGHVKAPGLLPVKSCFRCGTRRQLSLRLIWNRMVIGKHNAWRVLEGTTGNRIRGRDSVLIMCS